MLTRLKVSGFKNLVDVNVHFGPFTCIAGTNGVGKSNFFDAITFLIALAGLPLIEAARSVRDEGGRTTDVRSLFHRFGDEFDEEMSFEAEMIIPASGYDELGQEAKASITFVRYSLVLSYKGNGLIGIAKEDLAPIAIGEASKHLLFPHAASSWRKSAVSGRRAGGPFISTGKDGVIRLHQDGSGGRPRSLAAGTLPRTVVSVANAAESPTVLLARREMQSWRLLQLEPSSLRSPDSFSAPTKLGSDGSNLAATLNHLPKALAQHEQISLEEAESQVYGQLATRLADLINDVRAVQIDRDERRELLAVQVVDRDGTAHAARALSDGTLRFLALAVLERDPESQGVICLEEPENGIHPARIPAMLQLLQSIATDVGEAIGPDNPLRQVIVNTHSPAVVQLVPDDALLFAQERERIAHGKRFRSLSFAYLPKTWRDRIGEANPVDHISKGRLLSYLSPATARDSDETPGDSGAKR